MQFDRGGCGPQAQPRTRSCPIGLPEAKGRALPLTARRVWRAQIPLAFQMKATGPKAPPPLRSFDFRDLIHRSRTNQSFANAAIADAENLRPCGAKNSAVQQISRMRSFERVVSKTFLRHVPGWPSRSGQCHQSIDPTECPLLAFLEAGFHFEE